MEELTHRDSQTPLSDQQILQLAPLELPSYRAARYQADDICVHMDEFTPEDQGVLQQLYAKMGELLDILQVASTAPKDALENAQHFMQRTQWSAFIQSVREIGQSTGTWQPTDQIRKVLHDLKGGCFVTASVTLQMIEWQLVGPNDMLRLFFATRDYLKIMRTSLCDLDVQGYARDRSHKAHSALLLVDKWQESLYRTIDRTAKIVLDCRFTGKISERCLEFAALDRILYNLINNAAKNTADGTIYLSILPLPGLEPHDVRFVVYNRIVPEHQNVLEARYGNNLGALFQGGFTTGGTGLGMRICADMVANAYGLGMIERGLEYGYIGATCIDGYFISWFHWPVAGD